MNSTIDRALYCAKAVSGFVSAIAVALLTIYGPETTVGHALTVIVAVAGAVAVYAVPNRPLAGDALVDPDGLEYADGDDPATQPGEHRRED